MMMRCSSSHPQLLPPRPVVIERTLRAPSPSLVSSPTAKPLASQPPRRPPDPPTPACPPRAARGCGGRFLAAVLGLAALKVPHGGGKFKHSRRAAVAAAQPPCPAWRRLLGRLQLTCGGAVPRAQVGGECDLRLLLSPAPFALVVVMVTAAPADKGARAGRTEPCCGRGSSSLGSCNHQPSALTTPRPEVGKGLATLAKRCAPGRGSDRRPRRHVRTNTAPRFSLRREPRRPLDPPS